MSATFELNLYWYVDSSNTNFNRIHHNSWRSKINKFHKEILQTVSMLVKNVNLQSPATFAWRSIHVNSSEIFYSSCSTLGYIRQGYFGTLVCIISNIYANLLVNQPFFSSYRNSLAFKQHSFALLQRLMMLPKLVKHSQ